MPAMFKEFREFILKGNAIDLAVGVLIGAAFGGFVQAFTVGIVTPVIELAGGNSEVALQVWIFDLGIVINALFSLFITGLILFFIFVKPMNKLKKKKAANPPPPPEPTAEEKLLIEIRDLLKNRS